MAQKLTYLGCGDYLIPDNRLSYTEPLKRDKFVRMAEAHLKENNPFLNFKASSDEALNEAINEALTENQKLLIDILRNNPTITQKKI